LHGSLRSIARVQAIHCWTEITLANWPEAIQAADEGIRLAREIDDRQREAGAIVGQAMIAALRGEPEAVRLLAESERVAVSGGAQDVLTGVQLTRGVHELALGHYDAAMSALMRTFDLRDPSYHPLQSAWGLGDLAEAGFHSGRMDEAREVFAGLDTVQFGTPWQSMAVAYAAPFLASDAGAIDGLYQAALVGLVGRWPTYRTRLTLQYGQWLRRKNRIGEARDRLRAARESADALSMRPWAERARNELRATGENSSSFRPKGWSLLSPQELQVAQLAGAGLSNREIAERLFLSHRTVGSHLYRIFPKLGVTPRGTGCTRAAGAPGAVGRMTDAPTRGSGPATFHEVTRTSSQLSTESATSSHSLSIVRECPRSRNSSDSVGDDDSACCWRTRSVIASNAARLSPLVMRSRGPRRERSMVTVGGEDPATLTEAASKSGLDGEGMVQRAQRSSDSCGLKTLPKLEWNWSAVSSTDRVSLAKFLKTGRTERKDDRGMGSTPRM
jgi:DNA-binding CsgD family transcriptional regulator